MADVRVLDGLRNDRGYRLEGTAEARDLVERRILEAVAGLSAHQRIAMVCDGLLIPELPHPGVT